MPLFIRPQSFFQTNAQVAEKLYTTARDWVRERGNIGSMWDLSVAKTGSIEPVYSCP